MQHASPFLFTDTVFIMLSHLDLSWHIDASSPSTMFWPNSSSIATFNGPETIAYQNHGILQTTFVFRASLAAKIKWGGKLKNSIILISLWSY